MSNASPFPTFQWTRLYRAYECSQCRRVIHSGQFAFVPEGEFDDADDDEDKEADPLAYRHPKYVLCSPECLSAEESDHWEQAAADRELVERSRLGIPDGDEDEKEQLLVRSEDEVDDLDEEEAKLRRKQDDFLKHGILPTDDDDERGGRE